MKSDDFNKRRVELSFKRAGFCLFVLLLCSVFDLVRLYYVCAREVMRRDAAIISLA